MSTTKRPSPAPKRAVLAVAGAIVLAAGLGTLALIGVVLPPETLTSGPTPSTASQDAVSQGEGLAGPSAPSHASRQLPAAPGHADLELFKSTLETVARTTPPSSLTARTLTDSLMAAGFDEAAMERTADRTSADLESPTLTVSVRLGPTCLIGQYVRADASVVADQDEAIGTGTCLIGRTAPVR